jgi:hypothetical protein
MPERMTLREFAKLLQPYCDRVQDAKEMLDRLSVQHQNGGPLTIQERMELLRALAALAAMYDGCLVVVGETNTVPLVLIPGRLDLQDALIEAQEQARALARHFAALELPPTRRDLTEWWETEQAIGEMQRKNAAVGDEARHLLDRGRFREQAAQAAPRQPRPASQLLRKREQ